MRWLIWLLVILLVLLQYRLWVGDGSLAEVWDLKGEACVRLHEHPLRSVGGDEDHHVFFVIWLGADVVQTEQLHPAKAEGCVCSQYVNIEVLQVLVEHWEQV